MWNHKKLSGHQIGSNKISTFWILRGSPQPPTKTSTQDLPPEVQSGPDAPGHGFLPARTAPNHWDSFSFRRNVLCWQCVLCPQRKLHGLQYQQPMNHRTVNFCKLSDPYQISVTTRRSYLQNQVFWRYEHEVRNGLTLILARRRVWELKPLQIQIQSCHSPSFIL